MPNRVAWLALGIGAYLAFALTMFPAATAYRLFAPDGVRLAGIAGTLWSGSAALGSAAGFPFNDVRWSFAALPLLAGRLSGHVEARLSDGFVDTKITATPSRVVLRDLTARTSVPALRPIRALQGIQGLVSLAVDELQLEDGWPSSIVGQLRVADLAAPPLIRSGAQPTLIPLGDYEVTFLDTSGQGIAAQLRDTGGPLSVTGGVELDSRRRYTLTGFAAARDDASPELVQGLELMTGEPNAEGQRPFSLSGSL